MLYFTLEISFVSEEELVNDIITAGEIAENDNVTIVIHESSNHEGPALSEPLVIDHTYSVTTAKEMAMGIFNGEQ